MSTRHLSTTKTRGKNDENPSEVAQRQQCALLSAIKYINLNATPSPPADHSEQIVQNTIASMSAQEASKFVQQVRTLEDFSSFIGLNKVAFPFC
jgi:hypothetical protein